MVSDRWTPAGGAHRAAGVGQDHGGASTSRPGSGWRCTTPTGRSRRPRGAASPRSSSTTARRTFRDLERARGPGALAGHDGVLSLGGGAVLDADTQRLLAGHTVVYLHVGIADAAKRVGFDRSRPLLALQPARRVGAADGASAGRPTSAWPCPRRHRRARPRGHRRRDRRPCWRSTRD